MLCLFVTLLSFCQLCYAAPLNKQMVDMTYVFDNTTMYFPTQKKFELTVTFNGTVNDTYWLQMEEYSSAIHVGTHMDAPCHFAKGRWTVDQIPLSRLVVPAAVLDITQKAEKDQDYAVTVEDLTNWESETQQSLDEVVLLIRSGWGKRWHSRELFTGTADFDPTKLHFPGLHPDTAQWLVDNRNIYGVGTETLSLDVGTNTEYLSHRILLDKNIYGIENIANMDELPLYGATLYVMPMKIGNGSGAPVRLVATFPEVMFKSGRHTHTVTERSLREVIVFN